MIQREQFNKVWALENSSSANFISLKNGSIDTITNLLSRDLFSGKIALEFLEKSGNSQNSLINQNRGDGCKSAQYNFVNFGIIYKILKTENDPANYIYYLQTILNCSSISEETKKKLFESFNINISNSSYSLKLIKDKSEYYFIPSGVKEFTQKLVEENLIWLNNFPKPKQAYKDAIDKYTRQELNRNLLDDLRLSLELLLKEILGNSKSLENQKENLGKYLKESGVSTEISNMYWTLLDYYSKYQNNNVKHDNVVKQNEIEFILYQTGILMNLIINTNNNR